MELHEEWQLRIYLELMHMEIIIEFGQVRNIDTVDLRIGKYGFEWLKLYKKICKQFE